MIIVLGIFASFIFFILSAIHFNWVFGGTWGFDNALPLNEQGDRVLNPRKIDSAIVGLSLALFGVFYMIKVGVITMLLSSWFDSFLGWAIPIILLARAFGDLKYIGFTKKVKTTNFAKLDTRYYSPLCLVLGLITLAIKFF